MKPQVGHLDPSPGAPESLNQAPPCWCAPRGRGLPGEWAVWDGLPSTAGRLPPARSAKGPGRHLACPPMDQGFSTKEDQDRLPQQLLETRHPAAGGIRPRHREELAQGKRRNRANGLNPGLSQFAGQHLLSTEQPSRSRRRWMTRDGQQQGMSRTRPKNVEYLSCS